MSKRQAMKFGGMRMRAQYTCPNCGSVCAVRTSRPTSNLSREVWLLCLNKRCNWSGVSVSEIIRTVTMPCQHYIKNPNLPPIVEKERILALNTEHDPHDTKIIE